MCFDEFVFSMYNSFVHCMFFFVFVVSYTISEFVLR